MQIEKGLNSLELKIIALFCMTLDHCVAYGLIDISPVMNLILRGIGRIAAPIFLFLLTEGLRHTRSKAKYFFRLYIASIIVQAINIFLSRTIDENPFNTIGNIMPTFMYVSLFIICIEMLINAIKMNNYQKLFYPIIGLVLPCLATVVMWNLSNQKGILATLLSIFITPLTHIEYSLLFVLLGIVWYFINNKKYACIILLLLSIMCCFVDNAAMEKLAIDYMPVLFVWLLSPFQATMVVSILFIGLYNEQKGKSCKYLFYIYYPLHQYLICWLAFLK